MKKEKKSQDDNKQTIKPIVFVNNPIKSKQNDVIGFSSQVETIKESIDNGKATMVGIVADYGTGKSSMTEMIKDSYVNLNYPKPIEINMWDSLSDTKDNVDNDSVSELTKSFLFQLANGHNRKFGSYINKLLSKNYGTISFASNHNSRLFIFFILASICIMIYKITEMKNTGIMQYLAGFNNILPWVKIFSPIFILLAIIFAILGIKDLCIAFSHWKMTNKKIPEISDVFDVYRIIVDKIQITKSKKQLVFIDDLDRIENKEAVISFLKELYRFQNSICENKTKFVFIVSIMPESNLYENKDDSKISKINDNKTFSKLFDMMVYLMPIHFDDYDSLLLQLINKNGDKKEQLEELINESIEDRLPSVFKWIKHGSNLTMRDLKCRLNQAIAIMVSLVNKSYVGNSTANFNACAAVAYLENGYPNAYYSLIKREKEFADFIKASVPIINQLSEDSQKILEDKFNEIFIKDKNSFSKEFINDLCTLILDRTFDDDFRMYFYTYPEGSHIKTTYEREVCDYILYPNQYCDYNSISDSIIQAFKTGSNQTIENEIKSCGVFPRVILESDILFKKAVNISREKTFLTFKNYCLQVIDFQNEDKDIIIWKRILLLDKDNRQWIIDKTCNTLLKLYSGEKILPIRKKMIRSLDEEIINCVAVFINDNVPIITQEEIALINNQFISVQLINENKLTEKVYPYISSLLLSSSIKDRYGNAFNISLNIFQKFFEMKVENIESDILAFLQINQYLSDKTFESIYLNVSNQKIVNYINEFEPKQLSDRYLECINQKCITDGLSEQLLKIMMGKDYFITPISHFSKQNRLEEIDVFQSHHEQILQACKIINNKDENLIINIRKEAYIHRNLNEYLVLYLSPYPLMTKEEYLSVENINNAVLLFDVNRIEENDFEQIETIYSRTYEQKELKTLLLTLFCDEGYHKELIANKSILVNKLDYKKIGFKQLDYNQREEVYQLIRDSIGDTIDESIDFLEKVNGFIPSLEKKIINDKRYPRLIYKYDEISKVTEEWLSKNYINVSLSEKLCNKLYEIEDYQNYIIATVLRTNTLIIDDNIKFSDYLDVYKKSDEVFDVFSNHWDFLEKFQQEANFEDFDKKHIMPAYKTKQYRRFFEYLDKELSSEEKKEYYKTFGKFASLLDCRTFRIMVCQEKNMDLLGDYDICNHIREQLWEDDRSDKMVFTRNWNKRWKDKIEKM